jgi:hypothetical protein
MTDSMPQLLLLSTAPSQSSWRSEYYWGVERSTPDFCYACEEDSLINQLFLTYINQNYPSGFVNDIDLARSIVAAYAAEDEHFEIIEVVGSAQPALPGRFLGYDVGMNCRNSFLVGGLTSFANNEGRLLDPLTNIIYLYCVPRLNERGLFDDRATAELFLQCMTALQKLVPNLWEDDASMQSCAVMELWSVD